MEEVGVVCLQEYILCTLSALITMNAHEKGFTRLPFIKLVTKASLRIILLIEAIHFTLKTYPTHVLQQISIAPAGNINQNNRRASAHETVA